MKPGTLIRAIGAVLGALLALNVATWAQTSQSLAPEPTQNVLQEPAQPHEVSDEERADIYMARKSFKDAVLYYTRAIESYRVSPQNKGKIAALWNKMGIAYQQALDYKKSRKAYKKAIKLDRTFAPPWNNLGTTYFLNKKVKKSIKFYRHAVKLSPQSASFHLNLGTAYFMRKKYKKAFVQYRAAIQLDPNILIQNSREGAEVETRHVSGKFYFYMAKVFASLGDNARAVHYLERAMEEGFNNQHRILEDPDIKKISKDPAFIALMKNPPVAIGK